jgi:cysteinyl-tRNA synthetase
MALPFTYHMTDMAQLRLYNSLTRSVDDFAPADGSTVRLYTCGPTVYNPAHLGNFRTFLFEDLLRRTLKHICGWSVQQVMNLTDVDDKIIARASERGITINQLTAPVIDQFHADREFLLMERAEAYPRATEFIPQMIELVQRLETRNLAYRAEDGSVYFSIERFPSYGKLSRLDLRQVKSGARVAMDDYSKENAQDFALWKAAKPEDEATGAAWDSPWGRGRPGWHLECSAMAMHELGPTLDIHCGGVDLIFPHHEDEIAQSEGATGQTFSRFWCHGAFLLTEGAKMAKRVGNVWTVADLRSESISPYALRHFVFSTHYRKELNLVREAIDASAVATRRLGSFNRRLAEASGGTADLASAAKAAEAALRDALLDDLGAPEAMAALFAFLHKANAALEQGGDDSVPVDHARCTLDLFNSVLGVVDVSDKQNVVVQLTGLEGKEGLGTIDASAAMTTTPSAASVAFAFDPAELSESDREWLLAQVGVRLEARRKRDFATSDRIRDEFTAKGFVVEDTPSGPLLKRR